jgi:hypothetical protein
MIAPLTPSFHIIGSTSYAGLNSRADGPQRNAYCVCVWCVCVYNKNSYHRFVIV